MSELIEVSNYLILNYWWIIFPSAFIIGGLATYIKYKIDNNTK